ncbi:MAG TPA: HNH endonuclease [Chitinophagaceae bacterium]
MPKRFCDTEIWDKEWFVELSPTKKCLVQFLFAKCDVAGVWSPNYSLATFIIGEKVSEDDILSISNTFKLMDNGKIFIPEFIKFQYGKLSKDCRPHVPVYNLLKKHRIDIEEIEMSEEIGKTHNVSPKQKAFVLKQDNYTCCYCGKEKEERNLVIDHVVPRSKGGLDSLSNLVASCAPCNSKKWDYSLKEFCERQNFDFEIISNRVSDRLSQRLSYSLKEKEQEKDKERDKEKEIVKPKKSISVLFKDSSLFDFSVFESMFLKTDYSAYNLRYYYEAALSWSDSNNEKKVDWFAAIKGWMLRDAKEGRPVLQNVNLLKQNNDNRLNQNSTGSAQGLSNSALEKLSQFRS